VIGRLQGTVAEIAEEETLIDVAGVGYLVRCGARTLSRLPQPGVEALLYVETQWSEAFGIRLYGFLTRDERRAFMLLQTVQGVGPKAALGVLDVLAPADLAGACARGDRALVAKANGVGARLAQRIVVELRDKALVEGPIAAAHGAGSGPLGAASEAIAALMGLGWPEIIARRAVDQAALRLGEGVGEAMLIKAALQELDR
jgi:holliday junction DNA helicase RuvA